MTRSKTPRPRDETPCTCDVRRYPPLPPGGLPYLHAITCGGNRAATQPNAMIDPAGDVFYPDDVDDACEFARDFDAAPVDFNAFMAWAMGTRLEPGRPKWTPTKIPLWAILLLIVAVLQLVNPWTR